MTSGSGTAETITPQSGTPTAPTSSTEAVASIQDAENAVLIEKKELQNDVHPVVKSLWADFKGDLAEFKAWLEKELAKI